MKPSFALFKEISECSPFGDEKGCEIVKREWNIDIGKGIHNFVFSLKHFLISVYVLIRFAFTKLKPALKSDRYLGVLP